MTLCPQCSSRWYRIPDTPEHRRNVHDPRQMNQTNFQALYDQVQALQAALGKPILENSEQST